MKLKIAFLTLVTFLFLTQCATTKSSTSTLPDNLDERLLGSWSGSEKNQLMEGVESTWIQHRFSNGEFILLAIYNQYGELISGAEKGKWWIENGLFHELHYSSGKTDIYEYEVLDANRVKFRGKLMSFETNAEVYEFIDTRVVE